MHRDRLRHLLGLREAAVGTRLRTPVAAARVAAAAEHAERSSPRSEPHHYVVCTHDGGHVSERNLRRALEQAKDKANLSVSEAERLSWHSLRHSYASLLATDLELPATTLARLTGHTDAGFTLRAYARDGRADAAVVEDVLTRAAGAGIGA